MFDVAWIGVGPAHVGMDQGSSAWSEPADDISHQLKAHVPADSVGDNLTVPEIHDRSHVDPALIGRQIGDVGHQLPHGAFRTEVPRKYIARQFNGILLECEVIVLRMVSPANLRMQVELSHHPFHALVVQSLCKSFADKPFGHSLGPVGPMILLLDTPDGFRELLVSLVLIVLMTLPEVVGAGAQSEYFKASSERDSKSSAFANRS